MRATTELIIVAYWCAGGPGGRTAVGTLLMAGHNEAGDLVAIGQVGTGFSAAMRRHLYSQLQPTRRSTSPVANPIEAPGVQWVEPRHVAEIAYREKWAELHLTQHCAPWNIRRLRRSRHHSAVCCARVTDR